MIKRKIAVFLMIMIFFSSHINFAFGEVNSTANDKQEVDDLEINGDSNFVENESFEIVENLTENGGGVEKVEGDNETLVFDSLMNESFDDGNFSDKNNSYIDIDEIVNDFSSGGSKYRINENFDDENFSDKNNGDINSNVSNNENETIRKKISRTLVKDGEVQIEFKAFKDDNIQIEKREVMIDEFSKQVSISSVEHFDDELLVYSDLHIKALKKDIIIIWENKDQIVSQVNYLDDNGDGFVDRVSWVVPHLSTQKYRIVISVNEHENGNNNDINLTVNAPRGDTPVPNPIVFNWTIGYYNPDLVTCYLFIDDELYDSPSGAGFYNTTSLTLDSRPHEWNVTCSDGNITASESDFFDVFDFKISELDDFYFNTSSIPGNVSSQGNFSLKLYRQGVFVSDISHTHGGFSIGGAPISSPGNYELVATTSYYEEDINASRNFTIGSAEVSFMKTEIELGESVNINLNINVSGFSGSYVLTSGSVSIASFTPFTNLVDTSTISFSPTSTGNHELELSVVAGGKSATFSGNNILKVVEKSGPATDSKPPTINLIFPRDNDVIYESVIEFEYMVEDNVKIEWCDSRIYNYTGKYTGGSYNISFYDYLAYNQTKRDFTNKSQNVKWKPMVIFDERSYIWEVYCEDNSSNGNTLPKFNYFEVDLSAEAIATGSSHGNNYTREEEVRDLRGKIDSFLKMYSDFGLNERNVIEMLSLDSLMRGYDRKLNQIDQDLKYNLRLMDENTRKNRVEEMDAQINEIRGNIVLNLDAGESYEYTKNGVDILMGEFVPQYFDLKGERVKTGTMRSIAVANQKLQDFVSVRTEAYRVDIEYYDGIKRMIVVNKDLSYDKNTGGVMLEILGKDLEDQEIYFISNAKNLGKGVWELDLSSNSKITYYFYDDLPLQKIEKTESIIFNDKAGDDINMITGFVVAMEDGLSFSFAGFLIGFLFLGYVGFLAFGKVRLNAWKNRDPKISVIVDLIEATKGLLRENNVEKARDNYREMSEIYKVLPGKTKSFFFNEIKIIRLAIDKKDVLNLVKEYERARAEFRKDDSIELHSRINEIYKKLPKKFQDKVYRRLVKNEVR